MSHARGLWCGLAVLWLAASSAVAEVPNPAWQGTIASRLREAEYRFSDAGGGAFSAPNRTQDLRTFVAADGVRIEPRRSAGDWQLSLSLAGWGRGRAAEFPSAPSLVATENRVAIERGALREWYLNTPEGLEQGFDLATAPAGSAGKPLVIELRVAGSVAARQERDGEILFRTAAGESVLRYGQLVVQDASGRTLDSRLELEADRLRLVISDAGASYPVMIDPVINDPDWSAEANQGGAAFGISVASAGNVNGDAWDDIIVGADLFDNQQAEEGVVFVYYGSPSGPALNPSWTVESNQAASSFGRCVASAGDIDHDGFDDIIIGAPDYDDLTPAHHDEGWAFVFKGSAAGPPGGPNASLASAWWSAKSNQADSEFGRRVGRAGRVNNDLFDDIIIGAPEYSNDQAFEGGAFAYYGSLTGLGPNGTPANADWKAESNQVTSLFGHSLASAGNVNGDPYDDVIVGARTYANNYDDEGKVWLYLGSAAGLSPTAIWTHEGGANDMRLGVSVASAGDVNGDNKDDVVVGADIYSNGQTGEGAVLLF